MENFATFLWRISLFNYRKKARQLGKTIIARDTTDPKIDSVTWNKFDNNLATLALVANLATRLDWFKI